MRWERLLFFPTISVVIHVVFEESSRWVYDGLLDELLWVLFKRTSGTPPPTLSLRTAWVPCGSLVAYGSPEAPLVPSAQALWEWGLPGRPPGARMQTSTGQHGAAP